MMGQRKPFYLCISPVFFFYKKVTNLVGPISICKTVAQQARMCGCVSSSY